MCPAEERKGISRSTVQGQMGPAGRQLQTQGPAGPLQTPLAERQGAEDQGRPHPQPQWLTFPVSSGEGLTALFPARICRLLSLVLWSLAPLRARSGVPLAQVPTLLPLPAASQQVGDVPCTLPSRARSTSISIYVTSSDQGPNCFPSGG